MKFEIEVSTFGQSKFYFSLKEKEKGMTIKYIDSSKSISDFLNLDVDIYNDRLIRKVIQHSNLEVSESTIEDDLYKDIIFDKKCHNKKVYIERFEKEFEKELILATLGSE